MIVAKELKLLMRLHHLHRLASIPIAEPGFGRVVLPLLLRSHADHARWFLRGEGHNQIDRFVNPMAVVLDLLDAIAGPSARHRATAIAAHRAGEDTLTVGFRENPSGGFGCLTCHEIAKRHAAIVLIRRVANYLSG